MYTSEKLGKWLFPLGMHFKIKRALQSESKDGFEWRFCWTDESAHPFTWPNPLQSCKLRIKRHATETVMKNQQIFSWAAGENISRSGDQFACRRKSSSQYPFCARKGIYHHFLWTLQQYPFSLSSSKEQQAGNRFCFLTAVLVLLIESLHMHQFKQGRCLFN